MMTLRRLRYPKKWVSKWDNNRGVEIHPYYFSKAIVSIVDTMTFDCLSDNGL